VPLEARARRGWLLLVVHTNSLRLMLLDRMNWLRVRLRQQDVSGVAKVI
jgi:hypothetical protein